MQENLVIVESPAKAKTIEKFLGKDFIVKSSFGHIRDLAKKDLGINIGEGYKPVYEIPGDKKKVVDELTKLAKTDDPYTIGYDRAVEIVRAHQAAAAAANTPLKSFPEDADMLVKNGRYGPYIAYKSKNYRLPKGAKPEELTLDDCLKIVAGSKK